jgi:hypothetical protein
MAGIFISYRRHDTGGFAGRLYDRLCDRFGRDRVFRDVDTIEPGGRFPREIEEMLAHCDVVVALIGPEWLESADEQGRRRLEQPDDFVRLEIATALRRGTPVIPALLRNTPMPQAAHLPPDLAPLAECQAIELDDTDFHEDVDRLIEALAPRVGRGGITVAGRRVPHAALAGVLAVVAAAALALTVALGTRAEPQLTLRAEPAALSPDAVRAVIIERGYYSAISNPGGAGIPHAFRQEVVDGFPVVVDEATGLTWEQGGSNRIVAGAREGAHAYAAALNERRAGGFTNWRLPTVDEALSLLTAEADADYHMDPVFAAAQAPFIWTADGSDSGGWVVYYHDAMVSAESSALFSGYVRAVRSNAAAARR